MTNDQCPMTTPPSPRFSGIARLYGTDALEKFHRSRIAVIGIGGVGSWTVEALARSGVGHISLVDLDEICITNVNRQLHAMDGQIGRLKTAAMAERVRAIDRLRTWLGQRPWRWHPTTGSWCRKAARGRPSFRRSWR